MTRLRRESRVLSYAIFIRRGICVKIFVRLNNASIEIYIWDLIWWTLYAQIEFRFFQRHICNYSERILTIEYLKMSRNRDISKRKFNVTYRCYLNIKSICRTFKSYRYFKCKISYFCRLHLSNMKIIALGIKLCMCYLSFYYAVKGISFTLHQKYN